jgi:hypothetical protein
MDTQYDLSIWVDGHAVVGMGQILRLRPEVDGVLGIYPTPLLRMIQAAIGSLG